MLLLAHLGLGQRLANLGNRLPLKPVLLGCLLPDLVDKPLYYISALLSGRRGAELGLLSGTRTVGHTLLFLALILLVAAVPGPRRRWWLALAAGVATHLALDNALEPFSALTPYSSRVALLFPLYGVRFPVALHRSVGEHFYLHLNALEIAAEILGAALLAQLWRKSRSTKASARRSPRGF